jgi:hypothetical protein
MILVGFFTYIKYLISGDTASLSKIKELKILFKTFKSSKYRYITKDKIITNLFLQKIYNLYSSIIEIKAILSTTLFSNDEAKSMIYLNHYIDSSLPEDVRSKKDRFTKENMWQRIMEAENATKTIKEIEDEFLSYKNILNKKNLPKVESEYFLLYRLNSLTTFNFELFFSKFDMDYMSPAQPVYSPISGDDVLNEIEDLYFLISSLPAKLDLTEAFEKLYMRNQGDYKMQAKKAQQAASKIYKIISDELSPQILLNLCRYITENTKLVIDVQQKYFSILDKYRAEVESRFMKNKDAVLEKYSEKSLQQDIHSLFNGKLLLKIESYSESLRQLIENNNFEQISGIQAIRITKTFVLEIYEKMIKDVINVLILEGFFAEKEQQTDFSNLFFSANELTEVVTECEEKLSGTGKYSFNTLELLLKNYKTSSKVGENKIKMQIESINEKIRSCNERCANVLYKLASNIYLILQDYKTQKPSYITNIKAVKGSQNKEFISLLANSYNNIAKYIKIIKNFIVVKNEKKID